MLTRVIFDPPASVLLILGLGVIMAVVTIVTYALKSTGIGWFKKALLALVRLAALAAMLVILMRPMAMKPKQEHSRKPIFSVLVDGSESMNTTDVGEKSRYQAAVEALTDKKKDFLGKLSAKYNVRYYSFDKDFRRTSRSELASSTTAEGKETHIAAALLDSIKTSKARQNAGVLLISDGRNNEHDSAGSVRSAARHLAAMKVPVWTVPLGTSVEAKDVYVVAKLSSSFVFVDQPASILVSVTGAGYSDWYARINLYREDEYITSDQVYLRDGHASLSFPVRESAKGSYRYRVEIEPLAGESDVNNNKRSLIAKVVDETTRVLVVEAEPHWDSKFLLRALRSDHNVEVTSIFHINPNKTFAIVEEVSDDNTRSKSVKPGIRMPRTKDELFVYDCIFFGKDIDTVFSAKELDLLKSYLTERGGSIVFFRGKAYSGSSEQIAKIEPVEWDSYAVEDAFLELTDVGRSSPIFDFNPHEKDSDLIISELPAMKSIAKVTDEKSLAVVLARTKTGDDAAPLAAVVYQRYGKGKVMTIGSSGLWQWAFLPTDLREYDDVYHRFWGQMIRWLVSDSDFLPGQDVSFLMNKENFTPGEMVRMSVNAKLVDLARYKPRIEIIAPDGQTVAFTPKAQEDGSRIFTSYFTPRAEGEYKAVLYNNLGKPEIEEVGSVNSLL